MGGACGGDKLALVMGDLVGRETVKRWVDRGLLKRGINFISGVGRVCKLGQGKGLWIRLWNLVGWCLGWISLFG